MLHNIRFCTRDQLKCNRYLFQLVERNTQFIVHSV